jgi:DNA-binding transcriptional MerR regulator
VVVTPIDIFIQERYNMENDKEPGTGTMVTSGKTYYSISEVCGIIGVEAHVLRYWESEFSQLRPKKNRAGNRAYRDKDIGVVKRIRHLLYEEGYTIPGAKKRLAAPAAEAGSDAPAVDGEQVRLDPGMQGKSDVAGVKKELKEILSLLRG